MTTRLFRQSQPETIRTTASRLGISLSEASRLRTLENVRRRAAQIEAAYSLTLLALIVFALTFASAYQAA